MTGFRVAAGAVSVVLVAAAVAIGGGVPLSPRQIAEHTEAAADNARIAAANTRKAAEDTEALAEIADHVATQLEVSRRLLETQLEIEDQARLNLERAEELAAGIAQIGDALTRLERRLRSLSDLATTSGETTVAMAQSAGALEERLEALRATYDEVVEESRELNRKARGFGELTP